MKHLLHLVFLSGFLAIPHLPALCEEAPVPPARKSRMETMALNHSFRLLAADRTVTLRDGSFSGQVEGAAEISANVVADEITELNGDGKPDIAVIIRQHAKGNPDVYELSVLYSKGEGYEQSIPVVLGTDITVHKIYEEDATLFVPKRIVVSYLSGKMPDSAANPAYERRRGFFLDGTQLKDTAMMEVVKKPAIYLYPETETRVDVRLGPKGRITRTIPVYRDKWSVTVRSDGRIDRRYRYLFYEAALMNPISLPEEGWCVRQGDLRRWMDSSLRGFGLNRQEAKDFRAYWEKHLPKSKCWIIRLIRPEVVEDQLALNIQPRPQSLLRVILYFTPSETIVKLAEPEPLRFERKGFTVVEWGGILGGAAKKEVVK